MKKANGISRVVKEMTEAIQSSDKRKTTAYDTTAKVLRIDGETAWVHLAGGIDETPVKLTIRATPGDQVQVRVSNGRAWITGNVTNPPTDDSRANYVYNYLNGKLEVPEAYIHDLIANNITTDNLKATNGYIQYLISEDITAEDITADHAEIQALDTNYAHITEGLIDNAKIGYADVNDLDAHYAKIDFENVENSWITHGTIKDAAISDAMISGVSANKLTAGTIDASNITVTNLNASNITAGSITVDGITIDIANNEASIDGAYVEDGTITLSGLAQEVTDKIDGAIESFTGSAVPTLNNYPASSWSADERASHVGDVYYVVNSAITEDGYCYRFTHSNNTYSWTLIKDSDVTAALSRLTTAESNITNLQTFETNTERWITDTDDELSSLQQRTTTLETDMGDKVDVTTFNTLSQSVDTNTANITSLSTTVQNKADSSTVTTLSNTVSTVQQTANGNSSKLSNLITVLGTNADGTTSATDVVHRTSALEQDLSGFKTTVASTYYTQTDASALTGRVTSAESNITQNANAITTKVSQDGVISSINQSPESVTIDASRVNVTGLIQVGGIATTTQMDDAATKATNYLSPDGTGTVKVHPQTGTNNYVQIDNTGMTVYKGGNDMAFFGETARIGRNASGYSRTEIASTGVQFLRGSTVLANIGYGSGNAESGTANAPYYTMGYRKSSSALGNYSMAEGADTTASGAYSHAEGHESIASGYGSHAEGLSFLYGTSVVYPTASGAGSHVEGWGCTASSAGAHAEGNHTVASGGDSHAEGNNTVASGDHAHAAGFGTIAQRANQTVVGMYNVADTGGTNPTGTGNYLFIVGNGDYQKRSNALTVGTNGNVDITGTLSYKSPTIDASLANNGVSSTQYPTTFNILDKSGRILTRKEAVIESGGNISAYWYVRNYNTSGAQVGQKGIKITMNKSGAVTYGIDEPSKFLSALSMNKYTRSSAGALDWSNQTDGDSKVIMKSALAFWNGCYSGTSSNLSRCTQGQIIGRNQVCYANSRVDTFSSNGSITLSLSALGITTGAKPVGILLTHQDGGASPTILRYDYDASSASGVVIRAYNSSGAAVSGAVRYFAVVFQNTWTST